MTNPFAEDVLGGVDSTAGVNPFAADAAAGQPLDDSQIDVISRTNDPNMETPESFGLIEVAPSAAKGFAADILSFPQSIGGNLVELGENNEKIDTFRTKGRGDFENFLPVQMLRLQKDLALAGTKELVGSEELVLAGESMVKNNEAVLQAAGLVRPEDGIGKFGFDAGQAFSSAAKSVALTMITKNPSYAAGMQGWIINSAEYREARKAGKTPEDASYIAFTSAAGQAALESFGGRYFLGVAQTSGTLRKVVTRAAGQGAEESTQTAWEAAVKNATGVRNQTWAEVLADIGYNGALGFLVGAPVSYVAGKFEKNAVAAGIPAKDAKKMAAEFVKNKDEIVTETAQILHNEASGVAVDKGLQKQSAEAMKQVLAESVQTEATNVAIEQAKTDGGTDNPQIAAAAILQSPDVTQETKQAIKALPNEFTMQQLQEAVEAAANNNSAQSRVKMTYDDGRRKNYDVLDDNQKTVGSILTRENDSAITIYRVDANDDSKGKGYFSKAYEEMANKAIAAGKELHSDAGVSDAAIRLYDSLKKKGYGVIKNPKSFKVKASDFFADGASGLQAIKEPVFRVVSVPNLKQAAAKVAEKSNDQDAITTQATAISAASFAATAAKREFYERALQYKTKSKRTEPLREFGQNARESLDVYLAPIATRIRNINPKIAQRLNKFEQDYRLRIIEDKRAVLPFLEKMDALPLDVSKVLDLAMKNGDIKTINNVAEKYNMVKEIEAVRETLDAIYARAKEVGLEVGYRKSFFPRTVKDSKKLLAYYEKTDAWDDIAQAIKEKESEAGRFFTTDEKAYLINTLLRGYKTAAITLSKPGALKERSIEQVTPEIQQFYHPVSHSILQYVDTVNQSIEARRFFGKRIVLSEETDKRIDKLEQELEKVDAAIDAEENKDLLKIYRRERSKINNELDRLIVDSEQYIARTKDVADSIGFYVMSEMEAGNITGVQAAQLSDLLKARFNEGKMNSILKAYKNLSYIDTMGSPISAITQFSGLSFSLSNNGFYNTGSALFGKNKVNLADIGVSEIAAEFNETGRTSRWVKWVFNKVGLSALDRLDKAVFINSTLSRYQGLAKSNPEKLRATLEPVFENETQATIDALVAGENTENVKLLLFNELTAMQPITLSEMPEIYLTRPNGRIFYMLKTFTLKQYDIYRKQVYQEIATGNTAQGLKNLARLAFFMTLMKTGADALKDLLLGRETEMEDQVVSNIAALFGLGKYQIFSIQKDGLGTAGFKTIAPPFKLIDAISKDMTKKETPDIDDLKTIESIPIVGKFWYWWFGGGDKKAKPKYQ